jgi:predicted DNA-binding transcriptional regulator AlpA
MSSVVLRRKVLPDQPGLDHITLLDRHQVAARLGIGVWSLGRMVKSGQFPRQIEVSPNCYRWTVATVAAWIEQKAREPRKPRALRGVIARRAGIKRSRPRIRLYD